MSSKDLLQICEAITSRDKVDRFFEIYEYGTDEHFESAVVLTGPDNLEGLFNEMMMGDVGYHSSKFFIAWDFIADCPKPKNAAWGRYYMYSMKDLKKTNYWKIIPAHYEDFEELDKRRGKISYEDIINAALQRVSLQNVSKDEKYFKFCAKAVENIIQHLEYKLDFSKVNLTKLDGYINQTILKGAKYKLGQDKSVDRIPEIKPENDGTVIFDGGNKAIHVHDASPRSLAIAQKAVKILNDAGWKGWHKHFAPATIKSKTALGGVMIHHYTPGKDGDDIKIYDDAITLIFAPSTEYTEKDLNIMADKITKATGCKTKFGVYGRMKYSGHPSALNIITGKNVVIQPPDFGKPEFGPKFIPTLR